MPLYIPYYIEGGLYHIEEGGFVAGWLASGGPCGGMRGPAGGGGGSTAFAHR